MPLMTIDPLKKFKGAPEGALEEAMGLLPQFIAITALRQPKDAQEAYDMMMKIYGFGIGDPFEGVTVTPEGAYEYPEDPTLWPIGKFELLNDIEILVYQYAMVVVRDKETTLITRMD